MTSYRGISLMSIAAKVYNKILLNRIRAHLDPIRLALDQVEAVQCNKSTYWEEPWKESNNREI